MVCTTRFINFQNCNTRISQEHEADWALASKQAINMLEITAKPHKTAIITNLNPTSTAKNVRSRKNIYPFSYKLWRKIGLWFFWKPLYSHFFFHTRSIYTFYIKQAVFSLFAGIKIFINGNFLRQYFTFFSLFGPVPQIIYFDALNKQNDRKYSGYITKEAERKTVSV